MTNIHPRSITPRILANLETPDILILLGARQVGKTSLMGRKIIFHIDTLTFAEYLSFRNIPYPKLLTLALPQILDNWETHHPIIVASHASLFPHWQNFVVSGGFPQVVLSPDWPEAASYLREIKSTFLHKDIAEFYRFLDGHAFSNLVTTLAEQTGSLTNEAELANTLGISKTTVARYFWLLEQTFAVFRLSPFFTNKRNELSKMPKIYFHDTGWRNIRMHSSLIPLSERTDAGHLVENSAAVGAHKKIILNQLDNRYTLHFWRTNI